MPQNFNSNKIKDYQKKSYEKKLKISNKFCLRFKNFKQIK